MHQTKRPDLSGFATCQHSDREPRGRAGFLPGVAQERGGIIRHARENACSPTLGHGAKDHVILRKAYGGAYLAMCSSDMARMRSVAWPTAEIAVMGADGAVKILYITRDGGGGGFEKEEGPARRPSIGEILLALRGGEESDDQ